MDKSCLYPLSLVAFIPILTGCTLFLNEDQAIDAAANLVIANYQNATCEDVAQMQPDATTTEDNAIATKAIEILQNNPELRERLINRVAGPIANKMFECNLIP